MHRKLIGAAGSVAVLLASVAVVGATPGSMVKKDVKQVKIGFASKRLLPRTMWRCRKKLKKLLSRRASSSSFKQQTGIRSSR